MNAEETLSNQMDKPPFESKKFTFAKFGSYSILAVFVVSAAVFIIKPDTAGSIVVLAQIVVGAIAGITGIYLGAQGLVETRNSSSLAAVVESKKSEQKIDQAITITEKVDERIVREFEEKYKNDPSYRPIDTVPDMNSGVFR